MIFLKDVLVALAMWWVRKHATELVVDATIEALEKVSEKTTTQLDNDAVAKIKADKAEIVQVIKQHL